MQFKGGYILEKFLIFDSLSFSVGSDRQVVSVPLPGHGGARGRQRPMVANLVCSGSVLYIFKNS